MAYVDETQIVDCGSEPPNLLCDSAAYEMSDGTVVSYYRLFESTVIDNHGFREGNEFTTQTLEITLPEGAATWTHLALERYEVQPVNDELGGLGEVIKEHKSSWAGSIHPDWPVNGGLIASFEGWYGDDSTETDLSIENGDGCLLRETYALHADAPPPTAIPT